MTHAPTLAPTDMWPAFTTHSESDVVIAAVSLTRLVGWCGTPCVHTAAAVVAGTGGRPSETHDVSVVVMRVAAVGRDSSGLTATVDAHLHAGGLIPEEARLIGRASTAHTAPVRLVSPDNGTDEQVALPADLREGDLIAIPSVGSVPLGRVRNAPSREATSAQKR